MKEIIWIYGSSASGKETFIKHILNNPNKTLLTRLNLENKNIQVLQQSLDLIGEYDNDPKQKLRLNIPKYIINQIKKNSKSEVILIKGQDYDLINNTPNKLKKLLNSQYENLNHNIIFLHTDFETLYTRVKNKSWWTKELENKGINYFKNWLLKEQIPELIKLNKHHNFNIISINSKDKKYELIEFPNLKNIKNFN
jgi:predicted kinase